MVDRKCNEVVRFLFATIPSITNHFEIMKDESAQPKAPEHDKYMADLKRAIDESMKVFMGPTQKIISTVEKNHSFTITSNYKSINGAGLQLTRSKEGYQYSCPEVKMVADEVKVN